MRTTALTAPAARRESTRRLSVVQDVQILVAAQQKIQ
jgi:hypothetical protein